MLSDITAWWQHLPPSEQIFWAIGLISNVLFGIYVAFQFLGGHDSDIHHEHDHPSWGILSIRGILAFGMFMGWTGLVALRAGFSMTVALAIGTAAGFMAAWLAWRLILLLLRLQVSGTLELEQVVGLTGEVHLRIPAHQQGAGKIMVEAQGALRELEAISEAEAIPTGSAIRIVGLTEEGVFIAQALEHTHPNFTGK